MSLFDRLRAPWWMPYAVGAVLSASVLAIMIWQVVARGPFIAADWSVHKFFQPHVPDGGLRILLDSLSRPGQRWLTLPLLIAVGVLTSWRLRRVQPLLAVLVGLGSAFIVGKTVKDSLSRTPPFRDIDILGGLGEAFPSGHVANATLTWALITLLLFGTRGVWPNPRRVRIGFVISAALVLLVGTIMVVMDYHWLSDVPGGIAVGFLALMLALIALGPPPASSEHERRGDSRESLATTSQAKPIGGRSGE
jgi:membrane-associated phospholipid phosphatase